jgi:hypothetical protein
MTILVSAVLNRTEFFSNVRVVDDLGVAVCCQFVDQQAGHPAAARQLSRSSRIRNSIACAGLYVKYATTLNAFFPSRDQVASGR